VVEHEDNCCGFMNQSARQFALHVAPFAASHPPDQPPPPFPSPSPLPSPSPSPWAISIPGDGADWGQWENSRCRHCYLTNLSHFGAVVAAQRDVH